MSMIRRIRNFIGSLKSYGGCGICGDMWNWKRSHTLHYALTFGMFPYCEECHLSKPAWIRERAALDLIQLWKRSGEPDHNGIPWGALEQSVLEIIRKGR